MSIKEWIRHRKEARAKRRKAARGAAKKKRHYGIKISAKVFLAAHLALSTQFPPDIYEVRMQDMASGAIAEAFNKAAHKFPDRQAEFPAFSSLPAAYQRVLNQSAPLAGVANGEAFYDRLPHRYKADVLNLFAKSEATDLPDGSTVLGHLQSLREIDQDRMFANVDDKLALALDASVSEGIFNHRGKVDGSLHRAPGAFRKYASYKTYDPEGNLDITLSHDGRNWVAEIDIDYYKGLRHLFLEVAYHHAFDQRTDPYRVGQILRNDQGIDPGYKPK